MRGARWDEFDLDASVRTIPAERMKAGNEHRVPLSSFALAILKKLPKKADVDLVFSTESGKALSDMALTSVLRRMEVDAEQHKLRATFRDWAGELTNQPRDIAEQALAHVLDNKVEAAYRRGDALDKRRKTGQSFAPATQGVRSQALSAIHDLRC